MSRVTADRDETLDESADLTPRQIADGTSKDVKRRKQFADILDEALGFIRVSIRSADYLGGYTLTEVMRDRVSAIGPDVETTAFENGEIILINDPVAPTIEHRVATLIRSTTGMTEIEELVVLRSRVNAVVDALLSAETTDVAQEDRGE